MKKLFVATIDGRMVFKMANEKPSSDWETLYPAGNATLEEAYSRLLAIPKKYIQEYGWGWSEDDLRYDDFLEECGQGIADWTELVARTLLSASDTFIEILDDEEVVDIRYDNGDQEFRILNFFDNKTSHCISLSTIVNNRLLTLQQRAGTVTKVEDDGELY